MPLERYDRYFGGKPGSAEKAARALSREYGSENGRRAFYAIVNKRKRQGKGAK